jgi:hypothetical protein
MSFASCGGGGGGGGGDAKGTATCRGQAEEEARCTEESSVVYHEAQGTPRGHWPHTRISTRQLGRGGGEEHTARRVRLAPKATRRGWHPTSFLSAHSLRTPLHTQRHAHTNPLTPRKRRSKRRRTVMPWMPQVIARWTTLASEAIWLRSCRTSSGVSRCFWPVRSLHAPAHTLTRHARQAGAKTHVCDVASDALRGGRHARLQLQGNPGLFSVASRIQPLRAPR